jgi:DNA polymerase-1
MSPSNAGAERLYLLDGMALAYRSFFSMISRPLINSKGENTSAVYGFVSTLLRILDEQKPEHIAVVFDTEHPTFRHKRYPAYKATRQKMPEDLASQLSTLKDVVRAFNIPLLEVPGYEADDVMGTLARQADREGITTYLVTADKDFMQLVSDTILIYRPGSGGNDSEVVGLEGVRKKFGVIPDRVVDVLSLMGDKSDNVPGVPGVGEKTAIPLIQTFGSLEALYEHLDDIPQKGVREKLAKNRESAFLSKELVTIHTNVSLEADPAALRAAHPDLPRLLSLFEALEFRTLADRLREYAFAASASTPLPTSEPSAQKSIATEPHDYRLLGTQEDLHRACRLFERAPLIAVDTETTSKNPLQCTLVGISISMNEGEGYYIPVRIDNGDGIPLDTVQSLLGPILESPAIEKVGQNLKYDILVLARHGLELRGIAHDTMVAGYLLRQDGQHSLDALAMEAFGYKMIAYQDMVGKGKAQRPITDVPLELLKDYAAEDADISLRLTRWQRPRLKDLGVLPLSEDVEVPLIPVLARMERAGIALDVKYLAGMSRELEQQLEHLVTEIHVHAGGPFNVNSTQQLAEVLFSRLGLPSLRKTKTGYSTDVNVLEALRGQHPIIEQLLEYRQLAKLKSTYVDTLPLLRHPETGRVHTSFNQTVAATGRLSSSDPNLQNIPIRTEVGRAIRRAFVPEGTGMRLLSADYSQIELRIMAHFTGDQELLRAFERDEDIHATTAARVFGVEAAEVSRDMRRKAKEVNFGIMYGIGPFGLAGRLEISQAEARSIIARYFERFPGVKRYIDQTIATARKNGFVSTMLGRRRYLAEINSRNQNIRGNAERQAINMPIQGTAADMIKLAMIHVDADLQERKLRSRMLLQVHDELVFEVPEDEQAELTTLIRRRMTEALTLKVPIKVDVGTGSNWLEAH